MNAQNIVVMPGKNGHAAPEPTLLAPHSQETEEALLGSILFNPVVFHLVAPLLKPNDFFILRNAWVWEAMQAIHKRGATIEYITLTEELRRQKMGMRDIWVKEGDEKIKKTIEWDRLQEIGGSARITYLGFHVSTYADTEAHARLIQEFALRRGMIATGQNIIKLAQETAIDAYQLWETGHKSYEAIVPKSYRTVGIQTAADAFSDFFDEVSDLYANPEKEPGISTGFIDLDKTLHGLQGGNLIVLAGRPGMGKTSLQLSITANAVKAGKYTAFFSLEMPTREVMARLVSAEIGVNGSSLRRGKLSDVEYKAFVDCSMTIPQWPLAIDPTPALSVSQIRAKCLHLKAMGKLDIVFVDHLGLIMADNRKVDRHLQVAENVAALKALAKELDVPIVLAVQLNRKCEERGDKRPVLSDLAETDKTSWDADMVIFLYRDEMYNNETEFPNTADVIIAKNRNGATGTVSLHFKAQLTKFSNLKRTEVNLG